MKKTHIKQLLKAAALLEREAEASLDADCTQSEFNAMDRAAKSDVRRARKARAELLKSASELRALAAQ